MPVKLFLLNPSVMNSIILSSQSAVEWAALSPKLHVGQCARISDEKSERGMDCVLGNFCKSIQQFYWPVVLSESWNFPRFWHLNHRRMFPFPANDGVSKLRLWYFLCIPLQYWVDSAALFFFVVFIHLTISLGVKKSIFFFIFFFFRFVLTYLFVCAVKFIRYEVYLVNRRID